MANALLPLTVRGNHVSGALFLKVTPEPDGGSALQLSFLGPAPADAGWCWTDIAEVVRLHAQARGLELHPHAERLAPLSDFAGELEAECWELRTLSPWIPDRHGEFRQSLEGRLEQMPEALTQRARRFASSALASLNRSGQLSVDTVRARQFCNALTDCARRDLSGLRIECHRAELERIAVQRPASFRDGSSGWLEQHISMHATLTIREGHEPGQLPLWLAMAELAGIGQGTSKGAGALQIRPTD